METPRLLGSERYRALLPQSPPATADPERRAHLAAACSATWLRRRSP